MNFEKRRHLIHFTGAICETLFKLLSLSHVAFTKIWSIIIAYVMRKLNMFSSSKEYPHIEVWISQSVIHFNKQTREKNKMRPIGILRTNKQVVSKLNRFQFLACMKSLSVFPHQELDFLARWRGWIFRYFNFVWWLVSFLIKTYTSLEQLIWGISWVSEDF